MLPAAITATPSLAGRRQALDAFDAYGVTGTVDVHWNRSKQEERWHWTRPPLEQVKVPTLLISVEDDRYGTFRGARYAASQIPGARFVGYRDGGHLFVGHNEEVLTEIAAFLKTYGARALPR